MKTDDFEKRLQRIPRSEIPSAWREGILTAARQAETSRHPSPVARPSFLATLIHQLSALSRPNRAAWAGLAIVWVAIMALNFSARDNSTVATRQVSPPSPEAIAAWRHQRRELASLTEPNQPREIEAPKPRLPQPRSNRRMATFAA
jgi:hypothetical protein